MRQNRAPVKTVEHRLWAAASRETVTPWPPGHGNTRCQVAEGIMAAEQLTLTPGDCPGLSAPATWSRGSEKGKREQSAGL